jgi:hypothetical protein
MDDQVHRMNSREELELHARAEQVRGRRQGLAADLRLVDDEVESLAPQRIHHELLEQACGSLEKLHEVGGASLFWGARIEPARAAEQLRAARALVTAFQAQLEELEGRRRAVLAAMALEEENLEILDDDLRQVREDEERRKQEWVVEREPGEEPAHAIVMAWARGGEDDWRFRKALAASLLASAVLGVLLPMIDLPLPRRFAPEDVPRRLAQLVRQEQAKVLPPPPAVAQKPQDPQKPGNTPKPTERRDAGSPAAPAYAAADPQPDKAPGPVGEGDPRLPEGPAYAEAEPQVKAGRPGILAFKDKFVSLTQDKVAPRLGAHARFSESQDAPQGSSRSMLTTQTPGSSGGINLASLSRSVGNGGGGGPGALHGDGRGGGGGGGGGGDAVQGLPVGRATSPIASIGGGERPLAHGGPGLSRTDEEIQIVFDRYKASFYRLYNRELRRDPTLRGQMVLKLTIEPDGSVSMCVLQSTDMNAPELSDQVVNRVRTINFGAKDVQALTIVYPIDFLPAA